MSNEETLARLRWRSRRGMLELDVILERFLDQRLAGLDPTALAAYERLLEEQDHDLLAWLLKGEPAADAELQGLVDQIRATAAS